MRLRPCSTLVLSALALTALLTPPAFADRENDNRLTCLTTNQCGADDLCGKPIGTCDKPGKCADRPTACVATFAPVCGCDGLTYDNECLAARAGASLAALGPCEAQACASNRDCGGGFFCRQANGACGSVGTCAAMPTTCSSFMHQPVCGCDGQTYDDVCLASEAGVSVASLGACPVAKCKTSADCPADAYCLQPGQSCNGNGSCEARPEVCYLLYAPVCGCDGNIYTNSCFAAQAGVGVANAGDQCRGGL